MPWDCLKTNRLLEADPDGRPPKEGEKAFREHLGACPACRRRYNAAAALSAALASLPAAEPSPTFVVAVMNRVRERKVLAARRSRVWTWAAAGAAAALSACGVVVQRFVLAPISGGLLSDVAKNAFVSVANAATLLRAFSIPARAVGKTAAALTASVDTLLEGSVMASAPAYAAAAALIVIVILWTSGRRHAAATHRA